MKLYIVDAFTDKLFGGNQAGVILLREKQPFPDDSIMQSIAAELKHSETAFVRRVSQDAFQIRYFTPLGEVDLCGHATISAFTVLRDETGIGAGRFVAQTAAGSLCVDVEPDTVWLEMPQGKSIRSLTQEESNELYRAFRLKSQDLPDNILPSIVCVGLADIMMPVESKEALDGAIQDRDKIIRLSKQLGVTGVHMFFCPHHSKITAYCRNFAPLFGIDEECATGTSNASLTFYLDRLGLIPKERVNQFLQGESMGKPSEIRSAIDASGAIRIGGNAFISVKGSLNLSVDQ